MVLVIWLSQNMRPHGARHLSYLGVYGTALTARRQLKSEADKPIAVLLLATVWYVSQM